ncbi:PAS domain S-box protein [Halalkalibaculum sp. DA384]|uniref:PAS domain-containing sensor histidine kinase n=1 Tax=Halalkalibaculum sp. DA384 TaxID=3373606 RepID=UPI003754912C
MLLTSHHSELRNASYIWDFVDDVLSIPVPEGVFNSRINLLLQSRTYSLALKRKNKHLREQKERFRLIAENSTDMISRHAPDGTYLYASPSSEQLMGYTPGELVGNNAYEYFHPDDIPAVEQQHKFISPRDEIKSVAYRIKTKNDGYKWVETTSRTVKDPQSDQLVEIQASTRDISDRKAYEQQLEEEKEFVNTAVESLPGIFYMLDSDMNFIMWNKNFGAELGYSDEEIRRKHYLEYFPEKDQERLQSAVKKIWTEGYAEIEIDVLSRQDERFHYFLSARKLIKNGQEFLIGSGVDISARVEAETKHRLSEKRWEQLVQKNPGLVMISNRDKIIRFINPAGTELMGKEDPRNLKGNQWTDYLNLEDGERLEMRIQRVMEGQVLEPATFRASTWNGRELYVELQGVSIQYKGEEAILTIGKDVTQRMKYEQELEKSIREKEILLQEIHHRVKNNLAIISGLLELQSGEIDDQEVQQILEKSKRRIHSIAKVHELLYRNEELNRIDFKAYIFELIDTMDQLTHNPRLDISLNYELEPVFMNIDQAIPCGMVINELITNSIKHAFPDREEGTITIGLSENDRRVSITVADNGTGLPDFFASTRHKTLGKTIVELLVKQLDADFNFGTDNGSFFELSFEKRRYSGPAGKV